MGIKSLQNSFDEEIRTKGIQTLSKESLQWFYSYTKKHVTSADFSKVKGRGKSVGRPYPGKFYIFKYDPKHKETLPYYDALPLVLVTSVNKDGWTGINFHYMPPRMRMKVLEQFYSTLKDNVMSDKRKLIINWQKAERLAAAGGASKILGNCIKRYLVSHMKSNLIEIDSDQWDMMVFLPLSKFKKASARSVWKK